MFVKQRLILSERIGYKVTCLLNCECSLTLCMPQLAVLGPELRDNPRWDRTSSLYQTTF